MKPKVSDLAGAALDAVVAKALGYEDIKIERGVCWATRPDSPGCMSMFGPESKPFRPSSDWRDGGPIIEDARIKLDPGAMVGQWWANAGGYYSVAGETLLIAAMRAFVISRLGAKVDLGPE